MTLNRHLFARILFFCLLIVVLLFATSALLAQIRTQSDDFVNVADTLSDMAFFAAGDLTVSAKSTDDIFAAGGDISIEGAQADHMLTAGGDIVVTDVSFRDLIVGGGNLTLMSGTVTDDVVAAGGDINIKPDFVIQGSLMVTGGDVLIETPIGAELRAAAGKLRLMADVSGDTHLVGENITIGPNVNISGDLRYRAANFSMDPSAAVSGEIIELETTPPPDLEKWGAKAGAAIMIFAFAFLIGMVVLAVVIALSLPSLMNSSAAMIREKPLSTLGIGFLIVLAMPVTIALLFASVFGAPLAMLLGVIFLAVAPVAFAAFSYYVGMLGRGFLAKSKDTMPGIVARMGWTLLASILLILIGLIPIAGSFFWLVAFVLGVGAVMTRGGKALALKA